MKYQRVKSFMLFYRTWGNYAKSPNLKTQNSHILVVCSDLCLAIQKTVDMSHTVRSKQLCIERYKWASLYMHVIKVKVSLYVYIAYVYI